VFKTVVSSAPRFSRPNREATFKSLLGLASIATLLLLWWLAAKSLDSRFFPTPSAVFSAFLSEWRSGDLFYHLNATLGRVVVSFSVAMVIGGIIGIVLGRQAKADCFFDSWLILMLNLPALVVMVLCYIWFGLTDFAAILAVIINKVPNVAVTVREGARALDRDLSEMATLDRFGRWTTLRHVILPQLNPYFAAAARSGLALVWKIVLVVELLGRSSGVGFQIHLAFQTFDVAVILAYAFSFIAVVQMIEWFILKPWEQGANRWRR